MLLGAAGFGGGAELLVFGLGLLAGALGGVAARFVDLLGAVVEDVGVTTDAMVSTRRPITKPITVPTGPANEPMRAPAIAADPFLIRFSPSAVSRLPTRLEAA